jgi:O-glycosyl hydrolase
MLLPIALLITINGLSSATEAQVSIDPSTHFQRWEGFGTSLAWWAHVVGAYPEPLRSEIVKKGISDLGLTIVRYNIGGGEAPGVHSMESRARVPGYMHPDGTYDWTADEAQRWVLMRAKILGVDTFEAFSNSPPYFMTVSGSVTGAADGGNNLREDSVDPFARYLATVVERFRDHWGIRFETLDPMNEPEAPWWKYPGRQEGCHVSRGPRQSELILATRKALDWLGLDTKISACDESWTDWAASSWDALSPEAKRCVYRMNTHCYGGNSNHQLNERAVTDDKRLWMSEYGDGDASGMTLAHRIVHDLRDMQPSAWVYWQVVDGGGWGCVDIDLNSAKQSYTINPKYYVFGQFTKFIRPGSKFLGIDGPDTICVLQGTRLVIVSVCDSARHATFDLSRFTRLGMLASIVQTSRLRALANLPSVRILNKRFSIALPDHSVTTFVVDGCSYDEPVQHVCEGPY